MTLDEMTLLVLREGRKEGKKSPSIWLPFDVWLSAVIRLLPDEQRKKMTSETRPFWEQLWNRNRSPIEAIMDAAVSHPPAERPVTAHDPLGGLIRDGIGKIATSALADGDHPV